MKNILFFLFLIFSSVSQAESLQDFFNANPDFDNNAEARMAIKDQAAYLALEEASNDGGSDLGTRRDNLLIKNGGDYARIAIKNYKSYCKGSRSIYLSTTPDQDLCKFILSKSTDKENQELDKTKEILAVFVNSFNKSCVLIGKGDENGALSAINDAVYPGGKTNKNLMDPETFNQVKKFYMQFRVLDKTTCPEYTEQLLRLMGKK